MLMFRFCLSGTLLYFRWSYCVLQRATLLRRKQDKTLKLSTCHLYVLKDYKYRHRQCIASKLDTADNHIVSSNPFVRSDFLLPFDVLFQDFILSYIIRPFHGRNMILSTQHGQETKGQGNGWWLDDVGRYLSLLGGDNPDGVAKNLPLSYVKTAK